MVVCRIWQIILGVLLILCIFDKISSKRSLMLCPF